KVRNSAVPLPIPQALIGGPTGVEGLSWSAGLFTPYGSQQRYPVDGPQRYTLVDKSKSGLAFLGASLAYQITDSVRIGAGFHNMVGSFEIVSVISGYSGLYGRPEDRDLDILSRIKLQDFFVPTGNLGVWAALSNHVEAALSVQFPATIRDTDAKLEVRMPSHPSFDNARISNNTVQSSLNLPTILRAALRYTHEDFDIELTGVFERWSVFDQVTVQPNNINVENVPGVGAIPAGAMSIPQNWQNTFSVRLGGHYRLSKQWSVRAGYAFETGAPPEQYYSLFATDPNKHLIGGGMRHSWGNLALDASIGFYALEKREIDNSKVRQINPIDAEDELATIVGNGTYKANHLVVGTGITWAF
ncbi:MAG: OmpP1/FadL family transporter, partial [Bradymonadaceae bacterium]